MLRLAVEWNVLRASPRIKLLEEHGRTALIESSTEALLLQHAPQPLADIIVTIMDCGMRPEEVMRMRKEHIYWDRSVVLVPYGKSFKSKRYVPLSDRMRRTVKPAQVRRQPLGVPIETGGLRTLDDDQQTMDSDCRGSQPREQPSKSYLRSPTDLKLYCARHTFGTDMLAEGWTWLRSRNSWGTRILRPP